MIWFRNSEEIFLSFFLKCLWERTAILLPLNIYYINWKSLKGSGHVRQPMDLGLRKEVTRKRVTIKDGIILIEREWREEKTNVEMMTMDSRSFSTFMYLIFSVPHSWAHLLLFPHQYKVQGRSWDSNTHNHGSRPSLFNH